MQWKTVCFQCLQEVYNYQYPVNNILFKEDFVQSEASQTRFNVMVFFSEIMSLTLNYFVFLICSIRYVQHCRDMSNVLCCLSTSQSWSTLNLHCVFIKLAFASWLLYPRCRGHCNVGHDRVKIGSTSQPLYPVYIVDIVDIAMVTYNIDFTSYLHCLYYILFKLTASRC